MCVLQIPEVFCDSSKTNTGEEVDGKPSHHTIEAKSEGMLIANVGPCVSRVISWQKSLPAHLQCGVPRPRNKFGQAHEFRKLLQCMMTNDSLKKCKMALPKKLGEYVAPGRES